MIISRFNSHFIILQPPITMCSNILHYLHLLRSIQWWSTLEDLLQSVTDSRTVTYYVNHLLLILYIIYSPFCLVLCCFQMPTIVSHIKVVCIIFCVKFVLLFREHITSKTLRLRTGVSLWKCISQSALCGLHIKVLMST